MADKPPMAAVRITHHRNGPVARAASCEVVVGDKAIAVLPASSYRVDATATCTPTLTVTFPLADAGDLTTIA